MMAMVKQLTYTCTTIQYPQQDVVMMVMVRQATYTSSTFVTGKGHGNPGYDGPGSCGCGYDDWVSSERAMLAHNVRSTPTPHPHTVLYYFSHII